VTGNGDAPDDVRRALHAREPIFHRPEHGTTRADFEAMTDPAFWEVGASGSVYSRAFVLDTLEQRFRAPHDDPWEVRGFAARALAADVFLATYTLHQRERVTRRATVWRREGERYRALYHQGTLVSGGGTGSAAPGRA
jgi:hypothetical protein